MENRRPFPFASVLLSCLLAGGGVLLYLYTEEALSAIPTLIGVLLCIGGALELLFTIPKRKEISHMVIGVLLGLLFLLLGVACFIFPNEVLYGSLPYFGLFFTLLNAFRLKSLLERRRLFGLLYVASLLFLALAIYASFALTRSDIETFFYPLLFSFLFSGISGIFVSLVTLMGHKRPADEEEAEEEAE